jgi:hypothetical protein
MDCSRVSLKQEKIMAGTGASTATINWKNVKFLASGLRV